MTLSEVYLCTGWLYSRHEVTGRHCIDRFSY